MNQKLIIGIVSSVIIIGGVAIYYSNSSKTEMLKDEAIQKESTVMEQPSDKAMMKEENTMMKDETVMMTKAGSYESYEATKIAMASNTHDVVLFFRASWCPTCKAVDADIKSHLKDIPEKLTILDVDYDNSDALKTKYGVTYQHTFVQVDSTGKLITKWSGSPTLVDIVSHLK